MSEGSDQRSARPAGDPPAAQPGAEGKQTGENVCPACGGAGTVDGSRRGTCDGAGVVEEPVGDA